MCFFSMEKLAVYIQIIFFVSSRVCALAWRLCWPPVFLFRLHLSPPSCFWQLTAYSCSSSTTLVPCLPCSFHRTIYLSIWICFDYIYFSHRHRGPIVFMDSSMRQVFSLLHQVGISPRRTLFGCNIIDRFRGWGRWRWRWGWYCLLHMPRWNIGRAQRNCHLRQVWTRYMECYYWSNTFKFQSLVVLRIVLFPL